MVSIEHREEMGRSGRHIVVMIYEESYLPQRWRYERQ
jgi:hypothetical protein